MKKVVENELRTLSGGAHYAYVDCPCLAAGECKKEYKDSIWKERKIQA